MATTNTVSDDLFRVAMDQHFNFEVHANGPVIMGLVLVLLILLLLRCRNRIALKRLEIDEAELGIGNQKITLRPNMTDLQVAYQIWVELSTRKIGLPIDLDYDVIVEVYNSWYNFFAVARDHIKQIPAQNIRRKDTARIVNLSISVLNIGVRPHLTKWQARFRKWYEQELTKEENSTVAPQDIQKNFPQYAELIEDLRVVNDRLIKYRLRMHDLITAK